MGSTGGSTDGTDKGMDERTTHMKDRTHTKQDEHGDDTSPDADRIATTQGRLRSLMKERRLAQDREEAAHRSRIIQEHVLASSLWRTAKVIALYAQTRGEVDTGLLFERALAEGKTVHFPRVRPNEPGVMDYVAVRTREDFVRGAYGLWEPKAELAGVGREAFRADLVVIPGLAFSLAGDRVGFGGGYYDRFFTGTGIRTRIALCFAFQVVPSLPRQPWDVVVTHVCTEDGLFETWVLRGCDAG